jgi:release factor glutamine methyltransferase
VTVLEAIQRSAEFLTRKDVDSPRLQVELLLAHVLQLPRLKLYLSFDRVLTEQEVDMLRKFIKRRADREPLQYILGSTSFCGLEMAVNREVLIPRPETELLAERSWEFLQRLESEGKAQPVVLDFGTGSGCLAVILAVKCPQARIHALDISESALNVARQNAQRHQAGERIHFHLGKDFSSVPGDVRFDLLVSNPPYIPSAEVETLQPEVRDYEPRIALDGGQDGLATFRFLAAEAPAFMLPGGCAILEFADGQAEAVKVVFDQHTWIGERVQEDYSGRPRILIACRPK